MKTLANDACDSLAETTWATNRAALLMFVEGCERESFVARKCRMNIERLRALIAGDAMPTKREASAVDRLLDGDERIDE